MNRNPEKCKLSLSKDSSKLEIEPFEPFKSLPAGHKLDWPTWRSLRVGVGRSK